MKKLQSFLSVFMAFLMALTLSATPVFAETVTPVKEASKPKVHKVMTYLPCWESKPWSVDDIQGDKLTHVLLSFARIDNNFEISDDEMRIQLQIGENLVPLPDLVSADMIVKETWDKVAALQAKYPNLKFIVAVGGWQAEGFSDMVASPATREIFVDSVVKYVQKHNLNGIDLDWEYPVNGAWGVIKSREEDKANFTELVKLLRAKLGPDKNISFCASVGGWFLDVIDFKAVTPLVDSVNIMAYDMHGTWEDKAFHAAPLYPNPKDPVVNYGLSVSEAVDRFIAKGIPAEKLVVGFPAYGREFRNIAPGANKDGLFQVFTSKDKGSWVGGSIPYTYLKNYYIGKNGFKRFWDTASKVPYLYDGQTFITYEDTDSAKIKADYVKEKGLGGMMYWEYVNDVNGELLSAVNTTLNTK